MRQNFDHHTFIQQACASHPSQAKCSAELPFLPRSGSLTPVFAPVCLCLSAPTVFSLSPIFLPALVCQPLLPHITCWVCFPRNTSPTPTLLSLCPFPCFRGTCLDSGSLGGKRGGKGGFRPCWVVRRSRSSWK